jgi:hypothetical protein
MVVAALSQTALSVTMIARPPMRAPYLVERRKEGGRKGERKD